MTTATLADLVSAIESLYPPRWAVEGDAIGLIVGEESADVRRVLFAVDPVQAVIDRAIETRADLVVVHHPLLYRPVSAVAADEPKGRVIHDLITNGVALYVAHTNADSPVHGVSESMAFALGLEGVVPLVPVRDDPLEMAGQAADRGSGRLGRLRQPVTLREFADEVAHVLPATAVGARVAGDLGRVVEVVALVGGAGDSLLDEARASGADVYVTSDLRHHPASEFREHLDAPALIDVPHWAAEWTWLPVAEDSLTAVLHMRGLMVETEVSRINTDPWNYRTSGRTTP